jgi:hypothetical protein
MPAEETSRELRNTSQQVRRVPVFGQLPERWTAIGTRPRLAALAVTAICLAGTYAYAHYIDDVYALRFWLVWRLAALWFWVALWNLGCVSFGQFLLTRVLKLRGVPALESAVMSMATGVVAFALAMYAAGALALYTPLFAIGLSVAMSALGARDLWPLTRQLWAELHVPESSRLLTRLIGAAGVVCVAIVYLGVLSPDALNYDATWSHVVIAQEYARNGRMVPFIADYNRNVPHLASLIYTWGYLFPEKKEAVRWMFALHSEFTLFLWTLAGVSAAMRAIFDESGLRRAWVSFFLFPVIFVYDHNLGGASDHVCGFFSIPIALAALRLCERFSPGWAAVFALVSAGAVLTKLQALFLVLPACLVIAFHWLWQMARHHRARRSSAEPPATRPLGSLRDLLWAPAIVIVIGLGTFAPHAIRQLVFYNNPFYPFMQDVFVHSTPTVPNAAYLVTKALADPLYQPQGTFFEKLLHAAELFVTFSFVPHYSFTRDMPAFGSLFTLLFPCILFIRNRRLWLFAAIAAGAVLVWGMVYNVDRNLQAFMPVLVCVAGAVVVSCWRMGAWARIGLVPLVAFQIVWGSDAIFYSQQERLNQGMDLIKSGYEGNAHRRFVDFRGWHLSASKALPPKARVLLHSELTSLGIKREVLLDMTGFQGLIQYDHILTLRQLYDYLRAFGITHLIDLPDGSASSTTQEEVLWDAFVTKYGVPVRDIGALRIMRMPDQPPPDSAPLRVASIGQEGYADGIYSISALNTLRFLPEEERRYAAPSEPLSADKERWHEQLINADAVVWQKGTHLDGRAKNLLKRQFTIVRNLRGEFTVYMRYPEPETAPEPPPAPPDLETTPP